MEAATEEYGYFHDLGKNHWAFFADQGSVLLVSFETQAAISARPGNMPLAQSFAAECGWSHLCLIANGETWFRDPAVYAFFDRQVDDAFFEDFDNVLFYGAGMAGYAACAYSVTAPGAKVLALNPRATLDPTQAGADTRNRHARRLDFSSRYGYAPAMLEGVSRAVVVHDPTITGEAAQAALFHAPYITRLSARHQGDVLEPHLYQMGILPDMIIAAMAGKLDVPRFATLWRKRRDYRGYLITLLAKVVASGRSQHERMLCESVAKRLHVRRLSRHLTQLNKARPGSDPDQ